jgi:hypothetical protein
MHFTANVSRVVATLFFVCFGVFEIIHDLIIRAVWPGYTLAANDVAYILVPIWFAAAVGLWLKRGNGRGIFWVLAGVMAAFGHALVVRMGQSAWGYVFFGCAVALVPLSWRALKPVLREVRSLPISEPRDQGMRKAA